MDVIDSFTCKKEAGFDEQNLLRIYCF